jgi:hypothetical protein
MLPQPSLAASRPYKMGRPELRHVEEHLRRGEAPLSLDVAALAMMIRTARTIPVLNDATLCIQEKSSKAYFTCKLRELPHPSIVLPDSLQFGADCEREAHSLLLLCAAGQSHICIGESKNFDAFAYQKAICSRLLAEHGCTITKELPRQIAKLAKKVGLSRSIKDFHPAFKRLQLPSSCRLTSLVAKKCLEEADIVVTDETIQQIKGQADKMTRNDGACLRCSEVLTKEKRKFCGKCRTAAYCSRECQVGDWRGGPHKALCGAVVCPLDLQVVHDQTVVRRACFDEKKLAL